MQKINKCLCLTAVAICFVLASSGYSDANQKPRKQLFAQLQNPANKVEAFKDKDIIKIIVPAPAGGGYDRLARLIQPYYQDVLRQDTGAKVTIIVANVEGAGMVIGTAQMYRAKPDGKTLGIVGLSAAPLQQLTTGEFDLNAFIKIGQLNVDPSVIVVSSKSPFNKFYDLIERSLKQSVVMATDGQGGGGHINTLLLQAVLSDKGQKMPLDFVHYDGTKPGLLGIVKGETEAYLLSESAAIPMLQSGDLKAIAILSPERGVFTPNTPTLQEQGVPGAEEIAEVTGNKRILVTAPGTQATVVKALQDALKPVLTNSELIKKASDLKLPIRYGSAEEVNKNIELRLNTLNKYKSIILPYLK